MPGRETAALDMDTKLEATAAPSTSTLEAGTRRRRHPNKKRKTARVQPPGTIAKTFTRANGTTVTIFARAKSHRPVPASLNEWFAKLRAYRAQHPGVSFRQAMSICAQHEVTVE